MPIRPVTALLILLSLAGFVRPDGIDLQGDPLPLGALARLGTTRWRVPAEADLFFSADGKDLFAAGHGRVFRFDPDTGRVLSIRTFTGDPSWSWVGDLSLRHDRLLTLDWDRVTLWETSTGKKLREIEKAHAFAAVAAVLSPDGKLLATRSQSALAVRLWDVGTGKEVRRLGAADYAPPFYDGQIPHFPHSLAFSSDGKLAAASEDGEVAVWDLRSGERLLGMSVLDQDGLGSVGPCSVECLAFSPDGRLLAWGQGHQGVCLWDVAAGATHHRLPGVGPGAYPVVRALCFSPDGRTLVSAAADQNADSVLSFWDTATGREWHRTPEFPGWASASLAFTPNGRALAFVHEQTIRLSTAVGTERDVPPGPGSGADTLTWSPDASFVVTSFRDGSLWIWDVRSGKPLRELTGCGDHALSPDGRTLAVASKAGVRLLDPITGRLLRTLPSDERPDFVEYSPDGKILTARAEHSVFRWEMASGRELLPRDVVQEEDTEERRAERQRRRNLGPGADGRSLVLVGGEEAVELWREDPPRRLWSLPRSEVRAGHAFLSPDGRLLTLETSGSEDPDNSIKILSVREARTGKELGRLRIPSLSPFLEVRFAPDGLVLAVAAGDEPIRLWRVGEEKPFRALTGHWGGIRALEFSPDGKRLLSAAEDTTLLVWDVEDRAGPAADPSDALLQRLWTDLAAADAAAARRASNRLAAAPGRAVAFLKKSLKPIPVAPAARIAARLTDLDSEDFDRRQQAERELAEWGEQAEGALRSLREDVSVEVHLRAARLLALLDKGPPSAEEIRRHRALAVLERIGSPEAKQVLASLARGAPTAQQTREATAALQRLNRRAATLGDAP